MPSNEATAATEPAVPAPAEEMDPFGRARVRTTVSIVAGPVLLTLALGAATIGRKPLSRDEMATWIFSRLPLDGLVHATRHVDAAFLPYYALVHLTPDATGHPALVRAWSLGAAALTVAFTVLTATELWAWWAGVLAGALLALDGAFLQQAIVARPGALAAMFTAVSTYLLVRARRSGSSPRRRLWVGYGVSLGLLSWMSLFGAAVVAAHAVAAVLWWVRGDRRRLAGFAVAVAGGAVLALPIVLSATGQREQLSWITARSFTDAVSITEYQLGQQSWPRSVVTVAAFLVLVVGGLVRHRAASSLVVPAGLILVPPLALWLASQWLQPVELTRYAIAVPEGGALLVAAGTWLVVDALPIRPQTIARAAPLAVIVAVVVLVGWAQRPLLGAQFSHRAKNAFPGLVARIGLLVQPGQTIALAENYVATGQIAGIALYAHDRRLIADLERTMPERVQLVYPRTVVTVEPLRTVAASRLSGRVTVIGGPPTHVAGNPRLYWAAALAHDHCRLLRHGRTVSHWECG